MLDAINEITLERRESKDNPNEMFLDGQIKLYRIKGEGRKIGVADPNSTPAPVAGIEV